MQIPSEPSKPSVPSVASVLPAPSRSTIDKAIDDFLARAGGVVSAPGFLFTFEPGTVHQRVEKTTNQLAVAAKKDNTPDLLYLDDYEGVLWEDFLDALLAKAYVAMGAVALLELQKPATGKPSPTLLALALDALDGIRRRLNAAISGNDPQSELAKDLRLRIFGSRTFLRTRSSFETEYELVAAAMRELHNNGRLPKGVVRMLPIVEAGLAHLKGLPPTMAGRQPKPDDLPTGEVQVTTLALHLALGDLLSHASSTATDARLKAMTKVITPKRAVEPADEVKKDKEKTTGEKNGVEAKKETPSEAKTDGEVAKTPDAQAPDAQAPDAPSEVPAPGPIAAGSAGQLPADAPANGTPAPSPAEPPSPSDRSGRRKKHRMRAR